LIEEEAPAVEDDFDEAVRTQLVAIEDDWSRAIVANDAGRVADFITADWVLVSDSGITTGEQFLSVIRSGQLTHSAMDLVGERRIRVHGSTAVLTSRIVSTARYDGRTVDADEWTTDVFVKRRGHWRCALTQLTAVKTSPAG
jgi:ketosteroid isomerase-like protein